MSKGYLTKTEIRLEHLTNPSVDLSQIALGQLAISQSSVEALLNSPSRGPQQILATHNRSNKQRLPSGTSHPLKIPGSE